MELQFTYVKSLKQSIKTMTSIRVNESGPKVTLPSSLRLPLLLWASFIQQVTLRRPCASSHTNTEVLPSLSKTLWWVKHSCQENFYSKMKRTIEITFVSSVDGNSATALIYKRTLEYTRGRNLSTACIAPTALPSKEI